MPTVLSMCQGGIWCVSTRFLMADAYGRDCSHVTSDIGAIESGRWQASHLAWKIGAMSFVNVGVVVGSAALAADAERTTAPAATPQAQDFRSDMRLLLSLGTMETPLSIRDRTREP